jgi:hypothetical protein
MRQILSNIGNSKMLFYSLGVVLMGFLAYYNPVLNSFYNRELGIVMPIVILLCSISSTLYFIKQLSRDSNRIWQKNITLFKSLILPLIVLLNFVPLFGQNEIEMAVGSYTIPPTGPSYTPQVATMLENTTGATFVAYTPTLTITASLSNQQYNMPGTAPATGATVFGSTISGATAPGSTPVFNKQGFVGTGVNGNFTSTASGTPGSGIDVVTNYAFAMYNCVTPLIGSAAAGRFYYADLTLTFNRPVANPVIQIAGLGGTAGTGHTHTAELDLQTTGVVLSKLSGSTELGVSGNQILNNATTIGSVCGTGAACGSVLVSGSNITTLTFKVYIKGGGTGAWGTTGTNTGDAWLVGVSLAKVSGSVVNDCNGLTDGAINGIGTNAGGTLYAILVDGTNKIVQSVAVASNGTYLFTAPVAGSYTVILSKTTGSAGTAAPAPNLPTGWTSSGEGTTAAGDGTINTSTSIVVGAASIVGVNFGLQTYASVGGTASYGGGALCTAANSGSISLNGQTGNIVKWQTSTDAGTTWTDIVSTANPYSFSNAINNQKYRTVVNNGLGCPDVFSNAATITVNNPSVGGTTSYSGISPLCAKINSGTITLTSYTGAIVKWQTSTNSGTSWTDILNTTTTQDFNNALNNQQFRAVINNGTSCIDANSGATTLSATAVACIEICNDGIDNDGDGLIDCDDPDCGMTASALIKQ